MTKHRLYLLALTAALLSTACNSDDGQPATGEAAATQLQVELMPITRAAIEGSTLPSGSTYDVLLLNANNSYIASQEVRYDNGTTTLTSPVQLGPQTIHVFATYPAGAASPRQNSMPLSIGTQTDYLYGAATNADGTLENINQDNCVAHVRLKHALAMLRLSFTRSDDNDEACYVSETSLEEVYGSGSVNLLTGEVTTDGKLSAITMKFGFYAQPTQPTNIDLLLMPQTFDGKTIGICIDGTWHSATLPTMTLTQGTVSVVSVSIQNRGRLALSEPEILPRDEAATDSYTIPYAQR